MSSNKRPTVEPQNSRKKRKLSPKFTSKEIIKSRAEINATKTRKTTQRIVNKDFVL